MKTSIIKVYNGKTSEWEKNARVVLSWNGIANLGNTKPVYTDSDGIAIINHSSTGRAEVYINGRSYGSIITPGNRLIIV